MVEVRRGDFVQGSSSQPYATNHHTYQAPMHNVGQALNSNSGVNQGVINQFVYHGLAPGLPECLTPIPDASHTRNRRTCPPNSSCLPGTRKKVLGKLRSWVLDEPFEDLEFEHFLLLYQGNRDPQPGPIPDGTRIVWLCGPVGCGKSAISQAVADDLDERGLLLGCFFFFRGSGDRSRIARLVVTLADQMMARIPATGPSVESALKKPGLQAMSPGNQLKWLIFEPLQRHLRDLEAAAKPTPIVDCPNTSAASPLPPPPPSSLLPTFGPFLVLLDGLDECEDRDEVAALLDDILHLLKEYHNLPLRFLIASRIEEHIRAHVQRPEVHIENLRDHHPRRDIMKVVRDTFTEAAMGNLVIRSYGQKWPPENDVDQLVEHADGSFVFITTLLKYILGTDAGGDDGLTPMVRFNRALRMNPGLDGLYQQVLLRARHYPHFALVVLTIAFLHDSFSTSDLAKLCHIRTFEVVHTLVPLQSIFHVPGDDETPVTVFHTSLRDFILDEERSKEIISPSQRDDVRAHLAYETLKICIEPRPDGTSYHKPFALREYAEEFIIHHWTSLPGPAKQHLDFIFHITKPYIPTPHFQIAWVAHFTSVAITSPDTLPGAASDQHCLYVAKQRHSKGLPPIGLLLGAFLEIMTNTAWSNSDGTPIPITDMVRIREAPPGPDLHRCLAVHLMRCLFPCTVRGILDPVYAVEHWTRHLALGVAADSGLDNVALLRFLEAPYPCPEWMYPGSSQVGAAGLRIPNLVPNIQQAVYAIEARFPGLLESSPWAEGGREWHGIPVKLSRSCEGLSVLHMLRVFCTLLQFPDSKLTTVCLVLPGDVAVYFELWFPGTRSTGAFSWMASLETPESPLLTPETRIYRF